MMNNMRFAIWYFLLGICSVAMADVVISDGLSHDIDYVINESLYVYDSATGGPTRINVFGGAGLSSLAVFDEHSHLNMTGGSIAGSVFAGGLTVKGYSTATITGGTLSGCSFGGNSVATIAGGAVANSCDVIQNAAVVIDGNAQVGSLNVLDSPSITINGGQFDEVNCFGTPVLDISGGVFSASSMNMSVDASNISGGTFDGLLQMGGTFEISGGSFNGMQLGCSADVTFVGSGFAINGQEIKLGDTIDDWDLSETICGSVSCLTGVLTGTLADGTQMNHVISFEDCRSYGLGIGSVQFVPEPASMWLALAGCGLLARRRSSIK